MSPFSLLIEKKLVLLAPVRRLFAFIVLLLAASRACYAEPKDTVLLNRLFNYAETFADSIDAFTTNVYIKHLYQTHRRNFTLWVVPKMYAIARGKRDFVSEQYGQLSFNGFDDFSTHRQVYYTTIPHNRRTMPTLLEFVTPNIYGATIYGDHILSPFHRANRIYYRYRSFHIGDGKASLYFRPRFVNNTQLLKGQALVDEQTGRIIQVEMSGEFDMIRFHTQATQGEEGSRSLLPHQSKTRVDFRFLGNHISSDFEAMLDCPLTLPDTLNVRGDRQLIDSVRPYALSADEQAIYDRERPLSPAEQEPEPEEPQPAIVPASHQRRVGWDDVGKSLVESLRASGENGYVRLSPIINPQYIGYSKRKGISYRFKLGAQYNFSPYVSLRFNPRIGYNFRKSTFYYTAPLQLRLWPKHDIHFDLLWGNGNRITSSTILEDIQRKHGPIPDVEGKDLGLFGDRYMRFSASVQITPWLGVETGVVNHVRKAVNVREMRRLGEPEEYRTSAPLVSVKVRPLKHGPLISIDYEHGRKSGKSDLSYERWEMDAQMKHRMSRMQTLNMRLGGGFYAHKADKHFMDYSNFRDENLPEGWDDDWSGNFQLLTSRMYNESDYYVRGNVSYEAPLLAASFVPFVGRYVERERIYLSSLSIAHTRLYSELGYGFTCRYFSVGAFSSFLNTRFQEAGCKFTFELFRRW